MEDGKPADDMSTDEAVKNGITRSLEDQTYIAAPNILENGMCTSCTTEVDTDTLGIQCWECKNYFHATTVPASAQNR